MDIVSVVSLFIAGLIQKHLFSKLPNKAIPFVNGILGTAAFYFLGSTSGDFSAALAAGSTAAAAATGIHQALKIALEWVMTKVSNGDEGGTL